MTVSLLTWSVGLGAALALVVSAWLLSLALRDASIIDGFWGSGFALLAWLYYALTPEAGLRGLTIACLAGLWGARLSAHILWRSRGRGEDYRYREMRQRHGKRFPWVSLFTVFLLQGVLLWLISAPLLQAQTSGASVPTMLDLAALTLFAVGFLFETVGDLQLARFLADPDNRGKVMRQGLWRYTRHPNYFGDALVWWSFFLLALSTPGATWTVFSPVLMTFLLMKVSGVTLLERKLSRTRPEYAAYAASTNAFFPWFPRSGTAER